MHCGFRFVISLRTGLVWFDTLPGRHIFCFWFDELSHKLVQFGLAHFRIGVAVDILNETVNRRLG